MRIIFFGSSDFAVPILEALKDDLRPVLVVTQPDRKKGRFLKVSSTPVKQLADSLGIKTFQPSNVTSIDSVKSLKTLDPELFVVVSFGQLLSKELLALPKPFSLNVHASLLPKYRGAAPINWAIANGEKVTGITIIKMNERMDEGEIVLQEEIPIGSDEDAILLSEKLSKKSSQLLLNAIGLIKENSLTFTKQDSSKATYAHRLKKEDGLIDWGSEGDNIYNRIRAFVPWPGCWTYCNGKMLKIWKAGLEDNSNYKGISPGTVLEVRKNDILVSTGKGAIRIEELQIEGKRRMQAGEFIGGHRDIVAGAKFIV